MIPTCNVSVIKAQLSVTLHYHKIGLVFNKSTQYLKQTHISIHSCKTIAYCAHITPRSNTFTLDNFLDRLLFHFHNLDTRCRHMKRQICT